MNVKKEGKLSMLLVALLAASMALNLGLASLRQGGVEAFQEQSSLLSLYEGRVLGVKPDEYMPFDVEVNVDNVPTGVACKPSGRAADLYTAGSLVEGASVLVAVDPESRTGVVIDLVYAKLFVEPEAQPDEAPDGAGEPEGESPPVDDEGQADQADEPVESSQATVELIPGVELVVGVEPGPTPWLQAPEGKVKLTVLCQPSGAEGIAVYPPPGVYFVEKDRRVLFSCVSENPGWEFREWCVGRGSSGSARKLGAGDENLTRVLINVDTVITAFHSEVL